MSKHDEPNEYGFAGDPTLPEPPPKGQVDEQDRAEEIAVPGDDLTGPASEALYEETDDEHGAERRH